MHHVHRRRQQRLKQEDVVVDNDNGTEEAPSGVQDDTETGALRALTTEAGLDSE